MLKAAFLVPLLTIFFWSVISRAEWRVFPGSELSATRNYYLNDLLQPHSYSPAKNSFLFKDLGRGQRRKILDLAGSGSVRHVWSTWSIPGDHSDSAPAGKVLLRVFIDGEIKPSIAGTIDQLCRSAEATETRFVPFPAFMYLGAFNFYLPIYFSRSIRMEIEAVDSIEEFYTQIDYRLGSGEHQGARLISQETGAGLVLNYTGKNPPTFRQDQDATFPASHTRQTFEYAASGSMEFVIPGPGILRKLAFRGDHLTDLQLEIYWDDEMRPSVQAWLRYFFADFENAAIETKTGEMTCYFPMPFHSKARILLRNRRQEPGEIAIDYEVEPVSPPRNMPYFHAEYHEQQKTSGYSQYSVLRVHGKGLFVGVNLFDSGHNHGGGDSVLIDAGTAHPRMLHGICGEDYFSFAWHHTGTMTPLTGAPVHERRYRLHLENPYPFHESFQFLFGAFAEQHPRSVAFWYQIPKALQEEWLTFDIPWRVLGPLGTQTVLPDAVSEKTYETTVPIKDPMTLQERWQSDEMMAGFLDLTYQFRHYVMIESGTGYVAGADKTECITHIYSLTRKTIEAILGHDDVVVVRINDSSPALLAPHSGFGPSRIRLNLRPGWNTLSLAVANEENVDWRWSGVSLAFQRQQGKDLYFSADPPTALVPPKEMTR